MSAAKRVARAAKTIRARWERQVSTDPQTEAAQALEDTGQLLDPEVAAELVAFRKARELAAAVAEHGAFPVPVGPKPQGLTVEREREIRSLDLLALMSDRVAPVVSGHLAVLLDEIDRLREERHTTNEALSDAAEALRADRDRIAGLEAGPALPWAHVMGDGDLSMFLDDMVSAAMGRWRSGPEVPDRTVLADIEKVCADWRTPGEGLRGDPEPEAVPDAVRQAYMPVASLREDPHDSPLYHPYRPGLGRDLPETGGTR